MILDRALTWFANAWIALDVALNAINAVATVLLAPSVWAGAWKVAEIYSSLNLAGFIFQMIVAAPAIAALMWRDKRRRRAKDEFLKTCK